MFVALLLGFVCGFIGSIPIAGPVAVLVVERGLGGRTREGLAVAAGASLAEGIYAGLAFLGMTAALARFPWLLPLSRVLGALILIALGLYFALRKQKKQQRGSGPASSKRGSRGGPAVLGFVITVVNPTLLVTWSALVTMLHGFGHVPASAGDAPFFGLGVTAGIVSWFALFLALLRRFREKMGEGTLDNIVRTIGWILVTAGVVVAVHVALHWA